MPTLTQEQVWQATHSAKRLSFEPGAMILTEGTNADCFYIVAKGTVEVVLPRENQSDVIALQLESGKYFGEIEFFHEKKHAASIRASERGPVEVLCLTYEQLNELLGQSPITRQALQHSANQHEAENVARRAGTP
jgi:CRP-like cAMP-binding protein